MWKVRISRSCNRLQGNGESASYDVNSREWVRTADFCSPSKDASLIPSAERSVALKVLKYTFLLSSAPGAVGFLLCCTRVVTKKKNPLFWGVDHQQVCWSSSTLALKRKTEHMWLLWMQHCCFLECETVCHREYRPCGTEFGEEYLHPQYFYLPVVHDKTCKQSVTRRYLLRLCAIRSVTQCSFCTADRLHQSWTMASVWRNLVRQLHWLLLWGAHHVVVANESRGFKAPTKELCLFFQAHQVLFFAFVKRQLQFCFVFMFIVKCFEQGCFLWKHFFFVRVRV